MAFAAPGGTSKDPSVTKSAERADPVEALIQIANEAQESDAENERRLYDPCPLNGVDLRHGRQLEPALRKS